MITHRKYKLSGSNRFLLIGMILLGTLLAALSLQAISIELVEAEYLKDEHFKRISEYFDGQDNPGNRSIVRSQADRNGLYLNFELDQPVASLPSGSKFLVEIVDNKEKLARTYTFSVSDASRTASREVMLGITGEDWPDGEQKALAWRITLQDAQGNNLAIYESFLWSYPEN